MLKTREWASSGYATRHPTTGREESMWNHAHKAGKRPVLQLLPACLAVVWFAMVPSHARAELIGYQSDSGNYFRVNGYLRAWSSFNLSDVPETQNDDEYDLSMLRAALRLDFDARTGPVKWNAVLRAEREYKTDYLERLQDISQDTTRLPGIVVAGGEHADVMDQYNSVRLREYTVEFEPTSRIRMKLGRQQVVWGETDFFRALDIVHGFDLRWRSFVEPENEELRKPLILANTTIDVPELNGALQILLRPGWDEGNDIGNDNDLYGGRWGLNTFRTVDFLVPGAVTHYDYDHPAGDEDDVTWGARWNGYAGGLSYSVAYLKTFNPDPIMNSAFAPYEKVPANGFGDWIFPEIEVFGATASGYLAPLDLVYSVELAYMKDKPFNVGLSTPNSFFQPAPFGSSSTLPGFGGVIEKDLIVSMFRVDKQLPTRRYLNTSSDSFFSVQVFNEWIQDYEDSDEIVNIVGYNAPREEHTTTITAIFGLNYMGDTLNPSLAVGMDPQNAGGFVIPSVEYAIGNHWRLRAEANFFLSDDTRTAAPRSSLTGLSEDDTYLFGALENADQLLFRLTYLL